jgi:hypothetical protein
MSTFAEQFISPRSWAGFDPGPADMPARMVMIFAATKHQAVVIWQTRAATIPLMSTALPMRRRRPLDLGLPIPTWTVTFLRTYGK